MVDCGSVGLLAFKPGANRTWRTPAGVPSPRQDRLETPTRGVFCNIFKSALKLAGRIEFSYTPKHWSWLNIGLNAACADEPMQARSTIADLEDIRREAGPRATNVNERHRGVDC